MTRTERDGFTYESECTYRTDPATLVSIAVGDRVRVTEPVPACGSPYWVTGPRVTEFAVAVVGRDEFGLYLNGDDGEYGNTIIHFIEKL